ncbi:cAMP-binding domain of CRP or a regulatory subunit of cAMP-dependent protein kinases [Belliella pelovolcani]|uniref:cAMP-binding domain of CRP or a regulatory subunit of cAMP-dependent protein kinases n=2 Tax=Belliella pelovolcani TaxID=529505 RepID=A0A1N7KE14_9BACT|nr:cAMP-binding domain of CRP or a regulatory subunit of cAMP-dependent protein kinases [Belliella pelovolcani]
MKEDYDSILTISFDAYLELFKYLSIRRYKKNEIIKDNSQIEVASRYISKGIIALYDLSLKVPACRRIYSKSETVCDMESYLTESITSSKIVAYTNCIVCELPKENEFKVIDNIPEFAKLALRINHRNATNEFRWRRLAWKNKENAYLELMQLCPDFSSIKVKDICTIIDLPERSIYRLRQKLRSN